MKRIIAIAMCAIVLTLALTACGGTGGTSPSPTHNNTPAIPSNSPEFNSPSMSPTDMLPSIEPSNVLPSDVLPSDIMPSGDNGSGSSILP